MARTVSQSDTPAKRWAATGLIVFVVVVVTLSLAMFTQAFRKTVPITVMSDRSGLVMDRDAKVRSRGVEIGHVTDIRQELGGAVLDLEVYPDDLEAIPANSTVSIGSSTIFGAKSVDFDPPATPSTEPLREGAVVPASSVTTEVNTLFENLNRVLAATEPEKLNATLGAISGALTGRGDTLGRTLTDLDAYLREINPQIETLQRDLAKGSKTANLYADVTPDVMRVLDSGTDVGTNLVRNQQQFEALLAAAVSTGDSGKKLLQDNGDTLVKSMHDLRAATSLVAEYSPALTCLIVGLNRGVEGAGQSFGEKNQPGLAFKAGFQQGARAYENPKDLPKVNASTGPNCYGLPFPPKGSHAPFAVTDTGSNVVEGMPNVFTSRPGPLFGPLKATEPGKPAPPTLLQLMLGDTGGAR